MVQVLFERPAALGDRLRGEVPAQLFPCGDKNVRAEDILNRVLPPPDDQAGRRVNKRAALRLAAAQSGWFDTGPTHVGNRRAPSDLHGYASAWRGAAGSPSTCG